MIRLRLYHKRQKFRGWKVLRFAGFIRYEGKSFAIFFHHHLHTFVVFQVVFLTQVFHFYKTARLQAFQRKLCIPHSLKLSLECLEMDGNTLLTHVCADFMLSRMTMRSQEEKRATVEVTTRWNRSLTATLLASSASYFLISWQKRSKFFAPTVEYYLEYYMMSTFSATFSGAKV